MAEMKFGEYLNSVDLNTANLQYSVENKLEEDTLNHLIRTIMDVEYLWTEKEDERIKKKVHDVSQCM
jgi:hypothetical protein